MNKTYTKIAEKKYVVDVEKLKNNSGAFPCPKCSTIISPDDTSGRTYKLGEDLKMSKNGDVISLNLTCNSCDSEITLLLNNEEIKDE